MRRRLSLPIMAIRPRWRKMTWVILIWCALILAWAIGGGASADCENEKYTDACEAGTGIGIAIILFLGFLGFIVLSLIWFMTRPKGRTCPQCGHNVKKGQTRCASCGYSFIQAPRTGSFPPPPTPSG